MKGEELVEERVQKMRTAMIAPATRVQSIDVMVAFQSSPEESRVIKFD